ncbi:glucan ABC transporter ATP-binding protein/ permease [Prosthecomicrobium hirschii]|uniref:glucan ABC transporter ATP-binding protein/ permease n=1 Tax=Prosthecodimorpha hirschii TaxID=665126 RepID=UPI0009F81847|nr:glucan ABC transporter ATP-binding protein/ permease [Prosthecomicrobium hirschii]
MPFLKIYARAIQLLGPERGFAFALTATGIALAFLQLAEPLLFGRVIDALSTGKPAMELVGLWAGFGFAGVAANIFVALHADRIAHTRRVGVMKQFFEHVVALPAAFHSQAQSGRLISIMLSGADNLFAFWLAMFREHLTSIVMLIVLLPTALWINLHMGLLLAALMVIYVGLSALVVTKTHYGQAEASRHHAEFSGRVGDVIGNVTVVQSFVRLAEETRALQGVMNNLLRAQLPVLTWWALTTVMTRGAATITIVSLFALGTSLHQQGAITVGEIVSFIGFATALIGRLDQLTFFLSRLVFEAAAMRQFFDVLDQSSTIVEKPGATDLAVTAGHVVFDQVSFRYPGSDTGITDISFEARPGETVAIVGPTGSGKSTTVALLQRVRDPDRGRILIDGQDIADVKVDSVRRAIGVVFQDPGLFDRSIAENLRIGKPDATEAEIREAARLAECDHFVTGKPGSYDFRAGERGRSLSGGERQRLAIARAILKNAPILILDEATSALDTETEARIKRALERLSEGRTSFVIAHRLSTIRSADQILFMEAGRIAERGTFDELVARGGRFADLVAAGSLDGDPQAQSLESQYRDGLLTHASGESER